MQSKRTVPYDRADASSSSFETFLVHTARCNTLHTHHDDESPAYGAPPARRSHQQRAGARLVTSAHVSGNKVRACSARVGRAFAGDGHAIPCCLARRRPCQGAAVVGAKIATAAAIGAPDPDGGRRRLFHRHGARGALLRRRLAPIAESRRRRASGDDAPPCVHGMCHNNLKIN